MGYRNINHELLKKITPAVVKEFVQATSKHSKFNSAHEGYAVLLEEVDELWDEVKKKKPDKKLMREEAIQIAAMAFRFLHDITKM
jgi:NTP pyrophosphatase (non-canonical NTP hydrolase)